MRLVKITDNWDGTVILGTAKVVSDKNSNITTETEPSVYGTKRLKFKCRGASRIIECKDGTTKRKWQRMWCSIDSESVFAPIVRNLSYGDIVFIYGIQTMSCYTDNNGRNRKTSFCNLEYISVISKADGTPTNREIETEVEEDCEDEFGE